MGISVQMISCFCFLFPYSRVLLLGSFSLTVCIADGYAVVLRSVGLRIIIEIRFCFRVIGTGCHAVNRITLVKYFIRYSLVYCQTRNIHPE